MVSYEIIQVTSSRMNLHLQIQPKTDKPKRQISDFINQHCQGQHGIVYCAWQKDTVDLAHELKSANINAVFVHGDLNDFEKRKHERAWATGLAQVIYATKSFGMGIDQKDVRFVLSTWPFQKASRITTKKLAGLVEMDYLQCAHCFSNMTDHSISITCFKLRQGLSRAQI